MEKIRYRIRRFTLTLSYIGMFFLIPMMLLTTGDVIGRAVWSRPSHGTVELSGYMLAVFILLGVAYTQQEKGHVRVSMLVTRLPARVGLVIELVINVISLFIIFILMWQGWVVGIEEKTVSDMLRIPQLPFRLLVSLAGFALFLELLMDMTVSAEKLLGK